MISIIFIHYAPNKARSELGKRSFKSLYESVKKYPVEMIVVDNGGGDSEFFLKECEEGRITHYIRNANNIWYGYGRNQGLDMATSDYLCVVDNDIIFTGDWLEECRNILEKDTGKHIITPCDIDRYHRYSKYDRPSVTIDGKELIVNAMAGSSCWMMKREAWEEIGRFADRMKAGTDWTRRACKKGYSTIIISEQKAENQGLRGTSCEGFKKIIRVNGEKVHPHVKITKYFINGKSIILNE